MAKAPRVVVVGGVAAGMSAASQVRRRAPSARVVVFERGPHISYGACGMPYNIADPDRELDDLVVLSPEQARQERGIELHLGTTAVGLDLDRGVLTVHEQAAAAERHEPFDALVIATGARAVRPPIEGGDLPGVYVLRELTDGAALKARVDAGARRAVIVGGGYIGLEMAHVLTERGIAVSVVEKMPQLLPGWHADTVHQVNRALEARGVAVHVGAAVRAVEAGNAAAALTVVTDEGPLPADLVLLAVGIRPNVDLAVGAGITIGSSGAIWVSQQQQTSHPAVWAAGDCAEAYHRVLRRNAWVPLGTTANKQGRVAGANVAGAKERFRGIVGTAGFVTFDLEVARTGLGLDQARDEGFEPVSVTIKQQSRAHSFPGGGPVQVHLVADGPTGILLGAEITGPAGAGALRVNVIAAALAAHHTVADLQGYDLVYAPPFAPVWDPLLVAANQLSKKVGRSG